MEWRSDPQADTRTLPSRRQFVAGLGIGGALIAGFVLWPRRYRPNLSALQNETVFNGYLKIGQDGHVTVVVPQIELGQASTTLLPQLVADELGADWRTIGVEPASLNRLYANTVFEDAAGWRTPLALIDPTAQPATDESLALNTFAETMRLAGASARAMLCSAAAQRWGVDAATCETFAGFVVHDKQRLGFGALVTDAARITPPQPITLRQGASHRLIGSSLPRLDAPAKGDGSAPFAADIRLPDMVFATIRQGPLGETRVTGFNANAARKIAGAVDVIALPDGLACVGQTSWAAAKMLDAAAPRFATRGPLAEAGTLFKTFSTALATGGGRALTIGDPDGALAAGHVEQASYRIGLLPHVALEPMAATARLSKGLLEIWIAAQLPEAARDAAARAAGVSKAKVLIHSVMGGGSFGRRFEVDCAAQVAALAVRLKRPVQLFWSRGEDLMHDRFGGGGAGTLSAQVLPDGRINAWRSAIAAPPTMAELKRRTIGGQSAAQALIDAAGPPSQAMADVAKPPYALPNLAIDLHRLDLGIATGPVRGGNALTTCFFNESFINELSAKSGVEPFSFRMALLGGNTRLAQCLAKAAALGGWSGGGQGSNQGIACYTNDTACIAVVAEANVSENGRVRVTKLSAVADLGQLINPDVMRQQIEGGLLFGVQLAVSAPATVKRGIAGPLRMGDLHLPTLAESPEIAVDFILSDAPAADAWDVAVPPVAPAIAGALFAGSGKRYRTLPFSMDQH